MRIAITAGRQQHHKLSANSFVRHGNSVTFYTSTPPSRMRGFDPAVQYRFVPGPVMMFNALTRIRMPVSWSEADCVMFDKLAAMRLEECELMLGAASSCLASGIAAKKLGGVFLLDRACPDIRFQQAMMVEEAKKAGGVFRQHAPWFIDRQVREYEEADLILNPSDYSRRSYPAHIREKIVIAPLCGRAKVLPRVEKPAGAPFVVGVLGGQPLRKGYLYLLQAWKEMALPHAKLMIRTSMDYEKYPALKKLVDEQANVSIVPYIPDIGLFYGECDAFILPSVDDGFGMALFEAMAQGVPSVATTHCGASELLVAGRDALIIDPFSVQQIKDALTALYESRDLRERLGQAGQAAVMAMRDGDQVKPFEQGIERLLLAVQARSPVAIA